MTAAADSLAGWLLATGRLAEPARWLPLTAASMVLYASGTALNDVFDVEIDRAERPGRPLPSGRVSDKTAAWLGGLGLLIGPALALASGSVASAYRGSDPRALYPGYNAGLKHTWLGPLFMGACRGLNLLLGMSHAQALGGPIAWFAAVAYGLYVVGNHRDKPVRNLGRSPRRTRRGPGAPGPGATRLGRRRPGPWPLPQS